MSLISAGSISLDSTFKLTIAQQLDSCGEYSLRTWIKKLKRFVNTIAQFTNARSILSGFYKWKTMDNNQKKIIPQLSIDTKFFHSAFVNPCTMWNQKRSQSGVRLTVCLANSHYCMRWHGIFKGPSQDGRRADGFF